MPSMWPWAEVLFGVTNKTGKDDVKTTKSQKKIAFHRLVCLASNVKSHNNLSLSGLFFFQHFNAVAPI